MTSGIVVIKLPDGGGYKGADWLLIRAHDEQAVLTEARHQGYLRGARKITVTIGKREFVYGRAPEKLQLNFVLRSQR